MNLKEKQKECIYLLNDFDNFCKKNNLSYFLFYGSLLGAIRHKGFIPWDDDIDVVMSQNDFLRFVNLSKKFNNFYIKEKYDLKNNNVLFQTGWLRSNNNKGNIDIFVFKPLNENVLKTRFTISFLYLLYYLHNIQNNKDLFKRRNNFFKKIGYLIIKPIRFLFKLLHIFEFVSLFKSFSEKDFLCNNETQYIVAQKKPNYFLIRKSDIYPLKEMLFGNRKYPIPKEYHKLLTKIYGDYMVPPKPKDRVPLHVKT